MATNAKHTITFPSLPKVDDLLKELKFLDYSTALRNTCYDIEYLFFLEEILKDDTFYGGFRSKLEYERLKTTFTIIESLLHCLLTTTLFMRTSDNLRFPEMVNKAMSAGFIGMGAASKLSKLRRLRNQHHAGAQRDLHVHMGDDSKEFGYQYVQDFVEYLKIQNGISTNPKK